MNNLKTATQKHMTLDDRISIEKGLDQHLSLRSIALQLGKDPTTISKEIKKHRSFQEHNRFNEPANKCALAKDCKKKNIPLHTGNIKPSLWNQEQVLTFRLLTLLLWMNW